MRDNDHQARSPHLRHFRQNHTVIDAINRDAEKLRYVTTLSLDALLPWLERVEMLEVRIIDE